jgi:serine/threonine-protein kinase
VSATGDADPPATLGSYTVLTKLAQGGMATVYVGSKQGVAGFERLVAIKCCLPHLRDDEDFVTMFLDEARLAARIHHPNVVPTLDVGHDDVLYLVMDYVEGDTLVALLKRAAQHRIVLPVEIAIRVVIDALTGLHAAHELCGSDGQPLNLVHRDVSPQNILVGADGISRITDFGIAFAISRSTMTRDGKLKGKFSYMAPEQLTSQEATRRIDIFAAGIVLWEALTCRPLFRRNQDAATLHAVLQADVPAPSSIVATVPPALDAVVLKALNRNADERYQTAAEFADALEQLPIERATTRAVAAYVEAALGTVLASRRALIREASANAEPAFGIDSARSDVREKLIDIAPDAPVPSSIQSKSGSTGRPETSTEPRPPAPSQAAVLPADIEHRSMRGLLAAAMLLLVGSAIGVLLARSGDDASATPSADTPTASKPVHPVPPTKPVPAPSP